MRKAGCRYKKGFAGQRYVVGIFLMLCDVITVNFSYFCALWLRFDLSFSEIPEMFLEPFLKFTPFYTVFAIGVFFLTGMYNSLWRYASFNELRRILLSWGITTAFQAIGITVFLRRMPMSYYVFGAVIQLCMIGGIRFSYRFLTFVQEKRSSSTKAVHNAMVIGAGAAGQLILRELIGSEEYKARPVCVIDDDAGKWGRQIVGVPIVGGRDVIQDSVEKYHVDQILFAMPSASAKDAGDILNICKETDCDLRRLPGLYQVANGKVSLSRMKPVAVEDLLGREPVKVDLEEICRYITGRTILVTGGGGSIGSELCRQIAARGPERLIIFDVYENNAYEIQQELKRKYPELNLTVLIGSVRDSRRIQAVFAEYKPDIVYHAAAHKHVPLMEDSPNEAVKNNVLGTYNTACAAMMYGAEKFVLISTDKAVNPTNVMGASKRLCEMVIQSMDNICRTGREELLPQLCRYEANGRECMPMGRLAACGPGQVRTQFVAVRFGNVLGSNGSVIPLFKKQIEAGGPVTVTHPDIVRYFMTISEAVSLVLQAGSYAKGGEIFVLDMGEQVKIDTLARNLIRLSGFKPDRDIKIVYTGLRPGEKLYEEKLMAEEGLTRTANDLIHVGKPLEFDVERFMGELEELARVSYENSAEMVQILAKVVPTFHPAGKHQEESRQTTDVTDCAEGQLPEGGKAEAKKLEPVLTGIAV